MVIIFTTEMDTSTSLVIDWLAKNDENIIRINSENVYNKQEILFEIHGLGSKSKITLTKQDEKYILNPQSYTVWYRTQGMFSVDPCFQLNPKQKDIFKHMEQELLFTHRNIIKQLKPYKTLGSTRFDSNINKIDMLNEFLEIGLNVPPFMLTRSKVSLKSFKKMHSAIIVKCISESGVFRDDNNSYMHYTTFLEDDIIETLPEFFFPCYVQAYIPKKYEIRTFYLNEKCYSMAIFSQESNQTSIDLKRYDFKRPNRTVPYQLPINIEQKITSLMKKLEYNTGSFDIIRNTDGEYFFLELNPIGQFGMVSKSCNYHLEREMAKYLTKKS